MRGIVDDQVDEFLSELSVENGRQPFLIALIDSVERSNHACEPALLDELVQRRSRFDVEFASHELGWLRCEREKRSATTISDAEFDDPTASDLATQFLVQVDERSGLPDAKPLRGRVDLPAANELGVTDAPCVVTTGYRNDLAHNRLATSDGRARTPGSGGSGEDAERGAQG